jgi:hypothetical protein
MKSLSVALPRRPIGPIGVLLFAALAAPSVLPAQSAATGPRPALLAKYDVNHNGTLDPEELAALRADEAKAAVTTAKPGDALAARENEPITLNPYEVVTARDNGFLATNAGTATKLGLDMRDLAAPYSVMTGDFIKTVGITNVENAAIWATNGAPVLDGQGADIFNANGGARINNATTMYFTRGVIINAGQQRNFFINAGSNDTYNVERIDFGRGPNAVLFNIGASSVLGGGISTVGKRARVDRDFNTIATNVGSWDYYRSTLDVNKVLSDNFALRGNVMWQKRGGWQQGTQDNRNGLTLAGTWRINQKTELNVEVLHDRIARSRPPTPFGDNLSAWDGKTVVNGPITDFQLNGQAALTGTTQTLQALANGTAGQGQLEGVWRMGNDYVYDPATGGVMNWAYMGSTRRGDENPWVPIYINGQAWSRGGNNNILPIGNYGATGGNSRTPSITANGGRAGFTDMTNLPTDFSRQTSNSHFTIPNRRDSMLPNTPLYKEDTKDANFNITHKFSEELVFEAQGDANRVDMWDVAPSPVLDPRNLMIDINRNLPNGQANPHFLDAYGEGKLQRGFRRTENRGLRAALNYRKNLGAWGDYTFNASAMAWARDVSYRFSQYSLNLGTDPRDWHAYPLMVRYYQHDTNRPWEFTTPTSLFDRTAVAGSGGNDTSFTATTKAIRPSWMLTNWEERRERNKSATFAFAGRWFDDKLILSPGVRVGSQDTYLRWARLAPGWGALPNDPNWDGNTLDDRYWRPDAPADWKTLTYTPRDANGNALTTTPLLSGWNARPRVLVPGTQDVFQPDPRYNTTTDRFRDDYNRPAVKNKHDVSTTAGLTYHAFSWAAVKLSYGTSTLPADVGRFTLNDSEAKPEKGVAYDAAITFNLFNNKLAITPRYYFNRRENVLTGSPSGDAIGRLMDVRAWNETNPNVANPYNYPKVYGSDYFAQYNDGYELEVAGSITRGWRLSASLGTARVNDYNRWPQTQAYVKSRQDEFKKVLEAAGGMIDTTQKPVNGSRTVDAAPGRAIANPTITDAMIQAVTLIDGTKGDPNLRTKAVNAYNDIWTGYDQVNTQVEGIGLKRLSAKLVTDYTIQGGLLKGLRYGVSVFYVDRDLAGYRSGDTIPNPSFDPKLAVSPTNLPYKDNPAVDNNTPIWVKRPFDVNAIFGYSRRLHGWGGRLDGKEIEFQLTINNVLSGHRIYYQDDGVTLRPPNGDVTAPNRVAVPGRIAGYQRPMNFELTTTLHF